MSPTEATLVINRNDSVCSNCRNGANPHEETHDWTPNWPKGNPEKGCGAKFTGVSSFYAGIELDVQRMRPDLPWVDPFKLISGWNKR
jgi:hypothetical protein